MWAKVENKKVVEVITAPKEIRTGEVKYGRGTVFDVWSDADRKAIGILPINILNSVDTNIYVPQGTPELIFKIHSDFVDGSYPMVPKDTLSNLKKMLTKQIRHSVKTKYRDVVDDHYAEKYRVELDGGSHEISEDVKSYASDLKTNFASYKEAINGVTDISSLESISMVWPDQPND